MIRNFKSLTSATLTHFDQAQQTIPEDSNESPIAREHDYLQPPETRTIAVLEPSTCGVPLLLLQKLENPLLGEWDGCHLQVFRKGILQGYLYLNLTS